jgi:hypothetical protein
MDELLQALEQLNGEMEREGTVLNLDVVGGFSLFLQNLDIEVRQSHDIDTVNRLTESVREKVDRIGRALNIDLRWLNDDLLSLRDEFAFAGIDLEQLRFNPNTRIDFSNIHLNVIEVDDFVKLKLFSIFTEVYDFMQYGKLFERDQDLRDIKTLTEVGSVDYAALLDGVTGYVQDGRYGILTRALIDTYLAEPLGNAQINDFLKAHRG